MLVFDDEAPEGEGKKGIESVVVAVSALVFVLGAKRYCGPSCLEKYL